MIKKENDETLLKPKHLKIFLFLCFLFLFSFFIKCQCVENKSKSYTPSFTDNSKSTKQEILVGIHPLHNPERMQEYFGPIINQLNHQISDIQFTLESSKDYPDYNEKLKLKHFNVILPNPYQTILAQKYGYHVFAKMGDDFNFKGIILVRRDSSIKKIKDLKGKSIAFPAQTALAASILPQLFLYNHHIDLKKDIVIKYVGSQESSILSVFNKEVDAAGTWPPPWEAMKKEHPEFDKQLITLFETESLINNSIMARNDLNPNLISKIKSVILNLSETSEGKAILKRLELTKFEAANNEKYKVVESYIKQYNQIMGAEL